MMKRRVFAIVAAVALLLATTGLSGIAADALGYALTSQAFACSSGSHSGGGC